MHPTLDRLLTYAVAAGALGALSALPIQAQTIELGGQVRPRFEFRDPTAPGGGAESFTIGRTRIDATVLHQDGIWGFVQIQDVRIWGEESSTVGDFRADGLDLHQGFLQIGPEDADKSLRVGRFEQNYGGQRLIGAVGWAQQARAFDGVRGRARLTPSIVVDAFAFQLSESSSPFRDLDASFLGSYLEWRPSDNHSVDLFGFLLDEEQGPGLGDTELYTVGSRYVGAEGPWSYRAEISGQAGDRAGRDVEAWMAGLRLGRSFNSGSHGLALWVDLLSGSAPGSSDDGAFDTLFGTNHKFYGFADLILNPLVQLRGRGLQDYALKSRWSVGERGTLTVDAHRFLVWEDAGLSDGVLGDELDVVFSHPVSPGLVASSGVSYVLAGDALGPVRGISDDVTFFYMMLDFQF